MKQIIKCSSFYQDIDAISNLVSSLEFEENLYGNEIKDFHYIPEGLTEFLCSILNEQIEIQPDTGTFRKPSSIIHFDQFYQHALYSCIVALEDTTINIHTHKDGHETFFDVKDIDQFFIEEAIKLENWTVNTTLTLKKNDFVFIRPWVWKSLEQNKLVQMFLLNTKLG
jgi:hypothetical protein